MRAIPFVLSVLVFVSACSGGPTVPTPIPGPTPAIVPPTPTQPPPASYSALTISPPEGTAVPVGMQRTFTASGGDGRNYFFEAGPDSLILWEPSDYNMVKIQPYKSAGSAWIKVRSYDRERRPIERTFTIVLK